MWTGAVNPSKVTEYTPAGLHNNTLVNAFMCQIKKKSKEKYLYNIVFILKHIVI